MSSMTFLLCNLRHQTSYQFAIHHSKNCFIHGVEGVLKAELDFLLGRYDNMIFKGNYQKYGQVPLRFH
jgi:hypothetical protein